MPLSEIISNEEAQDALRLMQSVGGAIGLHDDTPTLMDLAGLDVGKPMSKMVRTLVGSNYGQWTIPDCREGGISGQMFGLWSGPWPQPYAMGSIKRQIAAVKENVRKNRDDLALCPTREDFKKTSAGKAIKVALALEGAHALGTLDDLNFLAGEGILSVGPAHFFPNRVCNSSGFFGGDPKQGLTPEFGRDVIDRCIELGLIVDLAHMNGPGFDEVIKDFPRAQVMISHTCMNDVQGSWRNTCTQGAKEIANRDGVIGIMNSRFLGKGGIEGMVEHVKFLCNMAGEKTFVFGFDYDGFAGASEDLRHVGETPKFVAALRREFDDETVIGFIRENVVRFFNNEKI